MMVKLNHCAAWHDDKARIMRAGFIDNGEVSIGRPVKGGKLLNNALVMFSPYLAHSPPPSASA